MISDLKPGQNIRCTVTKQPAVSKRAQTILRLMRRDPEIRRGMRRGQENRARTTRSYIRGGREWFVRQRCGQGDRVPENASWTMPFTPELEADLRSVEHLLKIEKA